MQKLLSAVSLAAGVLLAACGGGGENHGTPNIELKLDHDSSDTVTFRFEFSEAIKDFTIDKIDVINGSKIKLDPVPLDSTAYTLDVKRDHNNDNEILVSLAAGKVHDFADNPNAIAVSASHVFNTNLVWQDEFNAPGKNAPDGSRWFLRDWLPGVVNNELQSYTLNIDNAFTENGMLHIVAKSNGAGGYTSARLETLGKKSFTYGFIEVRAKLPCSFGAWPAIWMDNSNRAKSWPFRGEMDLVEWFGKDDDPASITATLHHGQDPNHPTIRQPFNFAGGDDVCGTSAAPNFHLYQLNWTPDRVEVAVDGVTYLTYDRPSLDPLDWPYFEPFDLILNVAVGGDQGGSPPTGLPYEMLVDYVRVYEVKP